MATSGTMVSKDVLERLLDVEKLKYCCECGICTGSCPMTELLGGDYNPRGLLERIFSSSKDVLASDELWLCAWCYRCHRRCNHALKPPEIFLALRKVAMEHGHELASEKALQKIAERIPLPLVTTLVCFHPERAGLDREKTLAKIEQVYKQHLKKEKARRAQEVSEEKIAVIGSGPAGLTVAYKLSRRGYGVTVFEEHSEPGGMLRKCIPDYRLPRHFLNKEIQFIKDLGVEIKTGVTIGHDSSFTGLWREGYKAIFVGAGAHKDLKLGIDGGDLKGIFSALDFLWRVSLGDEVEVGENVVVIGGRNVAMDAARVALSKAKTTLTHGAGHVTILYRRSREEMPAIPWEVEEAKKQGVKIELLVSPKRILGENGKVVAVECIRTQLGDPDESGRRKAIPIPGSEFKRETDMMILAIGETPDLGFLPKEVELNEDGTVWVNPVTMETSLRGVFAGGDAARGPATVIEAIRDGVFAANSIEEYLKKPKG